MPRAAGTQVRNKRRSMKVSTDQEEEERDRESENKGQKKRRADNRRRELRE